MAQQQLLLYNQSIPLSKEEFIQVQVWLEKPSEVVLKHSKKEESGSIITLSTFRFPLTQVRTLCQFLFEAEKQISLEKEIEAPILELYKKYGKELVERVFDRVRKERLGMST